MLTLRFASELVSHQCLPRPCIIGVIINLKKGCVFSFSANETFKGIVDFVLTKAVITTLETTFVWAVYFDDVIIFNFSYAD